MAPLWSLYTRQNTWLAPLFFALSSGVYQGAKQERAVRGDPVNSLSHLVVPEVSQSSDRKSPRALWKPTGSIGF